MKVVFYQTREEKLSINLLFDIIRNYLPVSINYSIVYYRYKGSSLLPRIYDVISKFFTNRQQINHIIGDFNYAAFFMPGGKTILTIHDLYRIYLPGNSSVKAFLFKWCWLRIPVFRSTLVTAISNETKAEIVKYTNCDPEKVKVIYNCISPEFKPVKKIFNTQKPVLLQVGTRYNKNMERIVQAITGLNCTLQIIGKPTNDILELLEQNKVDYKWESDLSLKQIIQKYIDCDVLVFVSTYEGFGMPIIEAHATERVVVTSNVSAMPEIAGDAACFVNPLCVASIRAGIEQVINDERYRNMLIEKGSINKKKFEATNIASQYCRLYQQMN